MWKLFRRNKKSGGEISPEDIFLDSSNIPLFDMNQMEGKLEKAIPNKNIFILGLFFSIFIVFMLGKSFILQVKNGQAFAERSARNNLNNTFIFADRGLITDRDGDLLAWNTPNEEQDGYPIRKYTDLEGFGNLLGFVRYPAKDKNGFYYKDDITGGDGIEQYFNDLLSGKNGLKIVETDVFGNIESQSSIRPAEQGEKLVLSIDAAVQDIIFRNLRQSVDISGFIGGGGIVMDVHTGEVLALVTHPSYDGEIMSENQDVEVISDYFNNSRNYFLDRAISGLYAPGSIVKPFLALGALNEGVISPDKKIESKGYITVPNPYFPDQPTIFKDWKVNGWTDARMAIAVSSDVYFYAIGGGYEDQKGMGIANIDKYISLFGFAQPVQDSFFSINNNGTIPTPEWKKKIFGEDWRLGDTYTSSIGQFGFQVTPLQAARAVAALVNGGKVIDPQVIKKDEPGYTKPMVNKIEGIDEKHFTVAKEGMRMAVTDGTLSMLNFPDFKIAAKTGTAEVGSEKRYVNSWVTGFFPYDNPRYSFALVLEKGPAQYAEGAPAVMQRILNEINAATTTSSYLR